MKDMVTMFIALIFVGSVMFLIQGCAHKPIQCQELAFTGDPEIDKALVDKCRHEKSEAVQKAIRSYDKIKGKAVEGIEKI